MSGAWGDSSLLFLNLHSEQEKLRQREKPRDGEMGIYAGLALVRLWLWANLTKPHRLPQRRTLDSCTALRTSVCTCVHTACWSRPRTVEALDTASQSKRSLLSYSADLLFFYSDIILLLQPSVTLTFPFALSELSAPHVLRFQLPHSHLSSHSVSIVFFKLKCCLSKCLKDLHPWSETFAASGKHSTCSYSLETEFHPLARPAV